MEIENDKRTLQGLIEGAAGDDEVANYTFHSSFCLIFIYYTLLIKASLQKIVFTTSFNPYLFLYSLMAILATVDKDNILFLHFKTC